MKKSIMIAATVIAISIGVQDISSAAETNKSVKRYGVVDVKKVVNSSKSVKDLKAERAKQKEQVVNFVKNGNTKVAEETDPVKKEELKKKLNNDLKYMTTTFDKRYQDNLAKINNDISSDIAKVGKEGDYDLILTTDAVLYGGKDITKDIIKAIK